ncbi:MAG TPA: prepilin peptidase [Verrucomicrobiae bacterium]|nr:prepilin peptidase [Verrucomicrobiae bacterium]
MENALVIGGLALLGLCFGSFVNVAVWRIKNNKNLTTDRSECVHCHHKLAWHDLIPVMSWLWLRGKCRYCSKPISLQYPLVELAVAIVFAVSYMAWPYDLAGSVDWIFFGLWLISIVLLTILFIYDLRWFLLPDKVTFPLIAVGVLMAALSIYQAGLGMEAVLQILLAVAILSGLYLGLFMASKGRWIGFGDVKLGIFLGLALSSWPLALLCLFLANLLGCLYVIPGMLLRKLHRSSRIPFGPFLIVGFIISFLWGGSIIDWYLSLTFGFV